MYQNEVNEIEFVRNTILVSQFYKLVELCGDEYPIIPLKGMSLLFSIYKDNYARNIADIDFFVEEKNVPNLVEKLKSIGYRFRKNHERVNVRLRAKHKFDMVNFDNRFCDLDIHTNLINKKNFSTSANSFTNFALFRLQPRTHNNVKILFLNPVDEWIYLAQHYCFHFFSNEKWLHDLFLIQNSFSDAEIVELTTIAKEFHFERIVTAVSLKLKQQYDSATIKISELTSIWRSLDFVLSYKPKNKFVHKILVIYWRFLFIDSKKTRNKAYLKLFSVELNYLADTYQCNRFVAFLLIPIHLLLCIFSIFSFLIILNKKIGKISRIKKRLPEVGNLGIETPCGASLRAF